MTTGFYASGSGDRLIDAGLLPPAVHEFLDTELTLLDAFVSDFDVLVEAGSMHGLHLEWAIAHDISYLGLDIVPRYIERGRRSVEARGLAPDRFRFELAGAEDLATVTRPPGRALTLFPFNSFGNMTEPERVLAGLSAAGTPFLISSYDTGPAATRRRREYYTACGYEGLRVTEDETGIRFTSPDGLDTMAYHPAYLLGRLRAHGLEGSVLPCGEFGIAYVSRHQ